MVSWEQYGTEYEKAEPFQKICIPYTFDRDGSGVVYLSDCTLGMAWFLEPIHASHLEPGEMDGVAQRLAAALALLEEDTRLQFIVLPTRNIKSALNAYRSNSNTKNPFLAELGKVKERYFANGVNGLGATIGDLEFCIKTCRIMVTCTVVAPKSSATYSQAVKDALSKGGPLEKDESGDETADEGFESGLAGVRTLRKGGRAMRKVLMKSAGTLESVFAGLGVRFTRASKVEFIQFYQSMVHIESGPKAIINPQDDRPLAEQVCRKEVKLLPEGYVLSDGYYHSILTVDGYPQFTQPGLLSQPHPNLGQLSLLDFVIDGVVCINISVPSRESVMKWNDAEYKLANEGEGDPIERQGKIDDCKQIRHWIMTMGRRMLDLQISVSMADKEKHLVRARIEQVNSKMSEMGFQTRVEESAAPSFWAHQLPFGWKPSMPGARRVRRRIDLVVADLLPIYLMGRGTGNPAFMALNQRGEPMSLDFFDSNTGYNFGIVAETGGGKSVLLNAISADYLRNNKMKMFIIDKGYSYRPLLNQVGVDEAEFIELSPEDKPSINPFEGTYESAAAFLQEWLPFLATTDGERLDGNVLGRMERVLRRTFELKLRKNQPYTTLEDLNEKYPDLFIARMAKRVKIHHLDAERLAALMELRSSEGGKRIIFDVFHEIRVTGRIDKSNKRVAVETFKQLQAEEYRQLTDSYPYVQDDEQGMYVLSGQGSAVTSLAFDGWECHLVDSHLVLEVADTEDYQALANAGVRAILPSDYLTQMRQSMRDDIVKRYGNDVDQAQMQEDINERIKLLDGVDYVSRIVGKADLQEEVFFREFAQQLRDTKDPKMIDLAERLSAFYGQGAYSKYFDKPTQFDLSKKSIFCWECEKLFNGDKKLVGAVLGALFHMITQYCVSPRSRQFQKIVFIDEYKKFQDSPITDTFVDETQRQGRKHGFCVGVGTQSINDLAFAQKKILAQMQFLLIGPQFPSVVDEMKDTLNFTPTRRRMVSSLKNAKGLWSEFLLYVPRTKYCETMRVMLDPLMYWLFTTDRQDKPKREEAFRTHSLKGKGPREAMFLALKECSEKWPRGVFRAEKVKM